MTLAHALLAEFEQQAPVTRRFLERLPEDKLDWRPHPKSMSAGQLALHLALVPGSIARAVTNNPHTFGGFQFTSPASVAEVLASFDKSCVTVREVLPRFSDDDMRAT